MRDVPSLVFESSSEGSGASPFDASSDQTLVASSDLSRHNPEANFQSSNGHHNIEGESNATGLKLCDDASKTIIEWSAFIDFEDELEE